MDKSLIESLRACVFLLLFLRGSAYSNPNEKHVTVLESVTAWEGSCVLLPCTYSYREVIRNLTWIHNPVYNDKLKVFEGKVVYNHINETEVDSLFKNNVQYVGTAEKDCTVLLNNLRTEHSGQYGLRLVNNKDGKDGFKWMSKTYVNVTVSDSGPSFKIHPVPEITEGDLVTLTCSINYYCPHYNISLTWIEDVNGTTKTEIKNGTSGVSTEITLTFRPTWADDNKNITCAFHHGDPEKNESESVQLTVKYAPKNVKILSNNITEFKKGGNINLECSVERSNPPVNTFGWYKDDSTIFQITGTIKVDKPGKYHCVAGNGMVETRSKAVEISMLYAPTKPVIKRDGNTIEGQSVTLNCDTSANPPVFLYIWYKNGEQCFNDTNSKFKFSSIKISESGSYTCEAYNKLGQEISSLEDVDVKYAPKEATFSILNGSEKKEGDQITLNCSVRQGNPKITRYEWLKDGNSHQITTSELMVKTLTWTDSGKYSCRASNDIGGITSNSLFLNVHYAPKDAKITFLEGSKRQDKKEGDLVTLQCSVRQSNPKFTSYEWFKDRNPYKVTGLERLVISITWMDSGNYACGATNNIGGIISDLVFLKVQYAPRNVSLSITPGNHVTEYTDVTLTCKAQSIPAECQYLWFRNDHMLESNHLINIKRSDAGEYYCTARNTVGVIKSETVYLHVSYSHYTIGIFVSSALGSLIFLIILVSLVAYFRVWKKCSKTADDSSFFVLKKSHNENHQEQQTPSPGSSSERLNYSTLKFPTVNNGQINSPRTEIKQENSSDIYSIVKKSPITPEYENIESSKKTHEETQDEIHYSIIANLTREGTVHLQAPEVEYAMLKH
ncbi:B-cell receptor CD22-like isoform X1 [Mixophyes fleayi]|uniref:B-cell receptor CD22-like isoform X1 n=1 Tax=Mixophyes fleayi TaxID=3061075 RepID=UPI003F4E34DB